MMIGTSSVAWVTAESLCLGCGTCQSICPEDAIRMDLSQSKGLVEPTIDKSKCISCGNCLDICPGIHWPESGDQLLLQGVPGLGKTEAVYVGCSTDSEMVFDAASGGLLTETLLFLLEKKRIDGAIVSRMDLSASNGTRTWIARSKEELMSARGSVYYPTPACTILKKIRDSKERFVIAGLPCHLAGLENTLTQRPELKQNIIYRLGLFCSRTPNANATRQLLFDLNLSFEDVNEIAYRGGGKEPGRLRILTKKGKEICIDHLNNSYWGYTFFNFFKPIRCWLCHDHSAALSDISFADNWTGKRPDDCGEIGTSMAVARSAQADQLLLEMENTGRIRIVPAEPHHAARSQELVKKSTVQPRLWLYKRLGRTYPKYYRGTDTKAGFFQILRAIPEMLRVLLSSRGASPQTMSGWIAFTRFFSKKHNPFFGYGTKTVSLLKKIVGLFRLDRNAISDEIAKRACHKIVMVGGYGWADIGDEAMPRADILTFRDRLDNLDIVMLSPEPESTALYHKERSDQELHTMMISSDRSTYSNGIDVMRILLLLFGAVAQRYGTRIQLWPNGRNLLDHLYSADLLFNVGGGNLNSVIPSELYRKCTQYLICRIIKRPVVISGQTIGPFTRTIDRLYARIALNGVDFISFRDKELSAARLRKIGVTKPYMIDTADDAISLPSIPSEKAASLVNSNVTDSWRDAKADLLVMLNLKGSLRIFKGANRSGTLDNEVLILAQIADQLIEKFNAKVLFIPTDYSEGVDDRVLHREVVSRMDQKDYAACIEQEYDDITLKGIISLAEAVIGVRYHFNVFAASELVPFLGIASGIYQQTKLKGLAALCNLDECYVEQDMEYVTFDEVWPKVDSLIRNRDVIRLGLEAAVPGLIQKSRLGVERAIEFLESRADSHLHQVKHL